MLSDDGFELIPSVLDTNQIATLRSRLCVTSGAGWRGTLSDPVVRDLASSPEMLALMSRHLGGPARLVRAILFDKSASTNWLVPWHQDLTIAVKERADAEGYGPWSVKDGIHHVQPPVAMLEQMLAIRLHLDDCDASTGALQVIPRTHIMGRLDAAAIQRMRSISQPVLCAARAGDALLMRPLLLHASGRATAAERRRRVLHIEYSARELPVPLEWS
ncbi:MAG: phytanoyl-CoA dioxygenase family protein [Verrucomicrobiaceae bacterium]|nr:phytanoyl-CoA dioxygenase family protein [Verrucomicrobiaceae bacterium]